MYRLRRFQGIVWGNPLAVIGVLNILRRRLLPLRGDGMRESASRSSGDGEQLQQGS